MWKDKKFRETVTRLNIFIAWVYDYFNGAQQTIIREFGSSRKSCWESQRKFDGSSDYCEHFFFMYEYQLNFWIMFHIINDKWLKLSEKIF